jgi:drug/metabolite transporter (DMT)-like permease
LTREPSQALGILCILVSAACYGSMGIFARVAYGAGVDVPSLLLLRFTLASVLLWGLMLAGRFPLPRGRGLAMLVAMGAFGGGQAFCYFTALAHLSAGLAALLLYTYPALVALFSWLAFQHPLGGRQIVSLAMALAGTLFTLGWAADGCALGIGFGLLAALMNAVYIMAGSRLPAEIGPMAATTVITSVMALVFLVPVAAKGFHPPVDGAGLWAVGGIAVVCTVFASVCFLAGLKRVGPVRASVFSTLEPLCALLLGAAMLGERVTGARVLGGALIAGAVVLVARDNAGAWTGPGKSG